MSHNPHDASHPSSIENDSHRDAHVHGLRLALGSILAPKRPPPPPHTGSYPVSGAASPFHHWNHPSTATGTGIGSGSGHDTPPVSPPPPPHPTPVVSHYQPHYQQAHQPTPALHPHLNHHHHSHAHPQPQSHAHTHAYGPSRLSSTHSTCSTPPESLSPSPTPSPRPETPPALDHTLPAYSNGPTLGDSPVTTTATSVNADPADPRRARFLATLQSKRAWDAMIHGSFV